MQKKKNTRLASKSLASDIFVTLLCLTGFYFSLYFFNEAINQSLDKLNETPIATITFKNKIAQRKLLDRVLWDRLKQDSPVYNGDIIRTSELSEATINFVDGNVMNLYEQTLAQVFVDLDGVAVDFTEGGISLDTSAASSGMTLTSGSATVKVETGSSLNAKAAPVVASAVQGETELQSSPLTLQMISGSANLVAIVNDASSEVLTLTQGNALVLSDGGQTFVSPSITVLTPLANAKFLKQTNDTLPVSFSWATENLDQSDYITLETSTTKNFNEVFEQISFTRVNEVSLDIPTGTWYWRLYPESDKTQVTSGKLQVLDTPLPTAVVAGNNEEYFYHSKIPSVRLVWSDDNYATSWQLEVADNAEMNNPVINQRTPHPSSIISSLDDGEWYWRVTPLYGAGVISQNENSQSEAVMNSFSIVQQGELEEVFANLPAEAGFVDTTMADSGITFSWQHNYEAVNYDIIISKNKNLSSPIITQKVNNNYFVLEQEIATLEKGEWYWSVTQTDSQGNISPQGEVRSFLAVDGEVEQRTIFPPEGYVLAENLVSDTRFTWKTNLPFATRFQIASDKEFANISIDRTIESTSISGLSLPIGTWYWRIVADTGETELEYNTPAKTVIVSPYLAAVALEQPVANSYLVVRPDTPVEYIWTTVENAQYYQTKLFHNSDLENPVYENLSMEGTRFSLDMENLKEGTYKWTVVAMALETPLSTRRIGIASEQTFIMRRLSPIELLSPVDGSELEGVAAILNPPQVSWLAIEAPGKSEFILTQRNVGLSASSRSSGARPTAGNIYLSIENPTTTTIQLPQLPEGTWYWTVVAENEDGLDISALQPSSFSIKPILDLPLPNNTSPQTNTVFGIEHLVNQHYVTFLWDAVEGASAYIFQIKNDSNEILFEEFIEDGTSYHLDDIVALDTGNFSWTVEAILRLPDDSIIQRGEVLASTFAVDLPHTIFPPDGYTLAENLVSDTLFTWKTSLSVTTHFQIASDKEFSNIALDRTLNGVSITDLSLPVGTWYWRVLAGTGDDEQGYYTPAKTLIVAPYLETVAMDKPALNSHFIVRPNTPVEYTWATVENAQYYQIKLFHSSDLENPVYENVTVEGTNLSIDMENMEEGDYMWTIVAMAVETPLSTHRIGIVAEQTFNMQKLKPIDLVSPVDGNELEGIDAILNPPQVSWSVIEAPGKSEFILTQRNVGLSASSRSNGTRPAADDIYLSIENPTTTIQLPQLAEGTWYWTVIAETEDGLNISAVEPSRIVVHPIPPLAMANNLQPEHGIVFGPEYLVKQLYCDFSWAEVAEADGYILRIMNDANETIIEERIDEGTSYRLENLAVLNMGTFLWTVEAVTRQENDNILQRGKLAEQKFSIELPQLRGPASQSTGELYGR